LVKCPISKPPVVSKRRSNER